MLSIVAPGNASMMAAIIGVASTRSRSSAASCRLCARTDGRRPASAESVTSHGRPVRPERKRLSRCGRSAGASRSSASSRCPISKRTRRTLPIRWPCSSISRWDSASAITWAKLVGSGVGTARRASPVCGGVRGPSGSAGTAVGRRHGRHGAGRRPRRLDVAAGGCGRRNARRNLDAPVPPVRPRPLAPDGIRASASAGVGSGAV